VWQTPTQPATLLYIGLPRYATRRAGKKLQANLLLSPNYSVLSLLHWNTRTRQPTTRISDLCCHNSGRHKTIFALKSRMNQAFMRHLKLHVCNTARPEVERASLPFASALRRQYVRQLIINLLTNTTNTTILIFFPAANWCMFLFYCIFPLFLIVSCIFLIFIILYYVYDFYNNNKQEFVRPRWPYDMRPSARAEKYMCHCNSLGGATWRSVTITGRTDRQTDRVRRIMRPPPREEGRIINIVTVHEMTGHCENIQSMIQGTAWSHLFMPMPRSNDCCVCLPL